MPFQTITDVYQAPSKVGLGQDKNGDVFVYWNVKGPMLVKPHWWDEATRCPPGATIKGYPDPKDPHAGLDGWKTTVGWGHDDKWTPVALQVYRAGKLFSDDWVVLAYLKDSLSERFLQHVGQPENLKDLLDALFREEQDRHPLADPKPVEERKPWTGQYSAYANLTKKQNFMFLTHH